MGLELLGEAGTLLDRFTQLCSAGPEVTLSHPVGAAEVGKRKRKSVHGESSHSQSCQNGRASEKAALSHSSEREKQEKLAPDPDDIAAVVKSHDNHTGSECFVPAPPEDILNEEVFLDSLINFSENEEDFHDNRKYSSISALSSISGNPRPGTFSTPTPLSPSSSTASAGDLTTISPSPPSSQLPGSGEREGIDGGRVGLLFGGLMSRDGERVKCGEGERGVLEKSMVEFDSFPEGVSNEELAKVYIYTISHSLLCHMRA